MRTLVCWTLISIAAVTNASRKTCCSPGKQLHPLLGCPTNPAALWNLEPSKTFTRTQQQGDFFDQFNESESCIPQRGTKAISPSDHGHWGLPSCPLHSLITFCDTQINGTSVQHSHNFTICSYGNCYSDEGGKANMMFPLKNSCLEDTHGSLTAMVCPCLTSVCIRKCCPHGELMDDSAGGCVRNGSVPDWRPDIKGSKLSADYFLLMNSFPPSCEQSHLLKIPFNYNERSHCFSEKDIETRQQFVFNADGSVKIGKYKIPLGQEEYCGEHTLHEGGTLILNNLLYCLPKEAQDAIKRPEKFDIYGVLLIIGGCFLVLTVVISCYLPELRGTLYHKVTICHNIALMVASFVWGTSNLLSTIDYPLCVTISLIIQFTFVSSFFWMNVMCIDIALAFKHLRSLYGPAGDKGWARFFWYSLYAWGCPLAITALTAAMELLPSVPSFISRPGFGCRNCGFNPDTYALLIYFYGPMIFILLFNLTLFTMTLLRIRQVEKQTAILKSKGSLNKSLKCCPDTQRLILFGKMFVLMGLTWGTEVISWWIGGPAVYWYIPDVINFLRAVFLFIVFVGKRTVWSSLRQKVTRQKSSALGSQTRRSKSSSMERREAEIERRGRILAKQITQTFRVSSPGNEL